MYAHTIKNATRRPSIKKPIPIKSPRIDIDSQGIELLAKLKELAKFEDQDIEEYDDFPDLPNHADHINTIKLKRTITAEEVKKKTVEFDGLRATVLINTPPDHIPEKPAIVINTTNPEGIKPKRGRPLKNPETTITKPVPKPVPKTIAKPKLMPVTKKPV